MPESGFVLVAGVVSAGRVATSNDAGVLGKVDVPPGRYWPAGASIRTEPTVATCAAGEFGVAAPTGVIGGAEKAGIVGDVGVAGEVIGAVGAAVGADIP